MTPLHNGNHRAFGLTIAAIILILDQVVKYIMIVPLALKEKGQINLLPFFDFTWAENRGVSMGMLQADTETGRWLLVAMTGALAAGVLFWLWKEKARGDVFGFALVLGGALGNIIDRVRYGYVVDFLDLHFGSFRPFFIFNVADAAITIGVLILLARALLISDKGAEKTETTDA